MAAKLRIFANQGNDDIAVAPVDLGVEDLGGCARRVPFGSSPAAELAERAGQLWWDEQPVIEVERIGLPGAHNVQNAMAAAAVCLARGIDAGAVADGLRSFHGVAHRLERIAEIDGVQWVNDSKATNVASTLVALQAFPGRRIHLIAGGRGKGQDFSPLAPLVARALPRGVPDRRGRAGAGGRARAGRGRADRCRRPRARWPHARERARIGETVLLSPACASYDQYSDFEARGEHFRALVEGRE